MTDLAAKVSSLWPEIAVTTAACVCMGMGMAPQPMVRRLTTTVAALGLVIAGLLVGGGDGTMAGYVKLAVVGVGLLLLMVAAAVPGQLHQTRDAEAKRRPHFEPGDVVRGEFFGFFLLSLVGVMLTAGSSDLVWLFLALELTSLPTYVMVTIGRDRSLAQESAVKYFFLGAMAAAVFLYGFAMLYGATGTTVLAEIHAWASNLRGNGQPLPPLFILGLVLAVLGICFKIAAVPMHFYAADVYEGASVGVTAFLAFVPKTAGFVALIVVLASVGWPLPPEVAALVAVIAALTMTVGNVMGLLQHSVKRVLAYSSIAHSGYMLVGLLAGPHAGPQRGPTLDSVTVLGNGVAGVLFYLVAYGLATLAAFAVLGCLGKRDDEATTFADIAGLGRRQPHLAAVMLLSVLSLIGLPPLVGFLGKLYLFGPAISAGHVWLVVVAVLNSAISAVYYLRIAKACFFDAPGPDAQAVVALQLPGRMVAAAIAAAAALTLGVAGQRLVDGAHLASRELPRLVTTAHPADAVAASDH